MSYYADIKMLECNMDAILSSFHLSDDKEDAKRNIPANLALCDECRSLIGRIEFILKSIE